MINPNNNRGSEKSDTNISLEMDDNRLKLLCGQFLLVITFLINTATLIAVAWAIISLGHNRNLGSIMRLMGEETAPDKYLQIDENIMVDTIDVGTVLRTNRIVGKEIELKTKERAKKSSSNTIGITLKPGSVTMQAEQYGRSQSDSHEQFGIEMPKRLDKLDILGSMTNIRSIRSLQNLDKRVPPQLDIMSDEGLELSGNRGVNVHAKVLRISSKEGIRMTSKEEPILIQLNGGNLLLPAISVLNSDSFATNEHSLWSPASLTMEKHQLCLNQANGILYQAATSSGAECG